MKQYCTNCESEVIIRTVDGEGDETYDVCPYCFSDHNLVNENPKDQLQQPIKSEPLPDERYYVKFFKNLEEKERERVERERVERERVERENAAIDYYTKYADFNREEAEKGFFDRLTTHK